MNRRVALRLLVGGLGLGGLLAGATAIRLRLGWPASPPPPVLPAGPPATPGENLFVTDLSEAELVGRGITRVDLGTLEVPTGRIAAADPLVQPERAAFVRTVAPGRYPVTLYAAQGRIALAELRFAPGAPARWVMALIPGQEGATLKPDEIYGYPVDAGLGCFMDEGGQAALLAREAQETKRLGDRFNSYDGLMKAPLEAAGNRQMLFRPMPDDPVNVAVFQSGWGDGFYASYWGLDAAGTPLLLVTDFDVLDDGEGRTPQQRWSQGELAAMTPAQRSDSAAGYAALQAGDLEGLEALLKQGRITPQTAIEKTSVPFTYMAIATDEPSVLDILIRYGADRAIPSGLGTSWTTYADFARSYSRTKPDGSPEYDWLKPRSAALMAVIRRWDAMPPNPH